MEQKLNVPNKTYFALSLLSSTTYVTDSDILLICIAPKSHKLILKAASSRENCIDSAANSFFFIFSIA